MARRNKVKVLSASEMLAMAQKAETEVIYERTRLQIEEMQGRHVLRRDVLKRLRDTAGVTVQDILEKKHGAPNVVRLKDLTKVPEHVARAVKKVKVTTHTTSEGDTTQTVEVELAHHLSYDELIGKHLGLFSDKAVQVNILNNSQPAETGAPAPANLYDLPPDQVRAHRIRLEKEVEALSVRD
jgi:hypothetical protein